MGYFYKKEDLFKPNIFLNHIEYEVHNYIISEIFSNKFLTSVKVKLEFHIIRYLTCKIILYLI